MNLDQQIRATINDRSPNEGGDLVEILEAVLDLPPMRPGVDSPSLWMAAGYSQALADVRVEIADRLGIQPPAEGADYVLERDSGAALGAVVQHVEGQA